MKISCRICKIQQGEFFTLDSMVAICGQKEQKLVDIYNQSLQLNAFLQDALPQVLCITCFQKLKEFFEFKLKAEKSDRELRKNLPVTSDQIVKTDFLDNNNVPKKIDIKLKVDDMTTEDTTEEIKQSYEDESINDNEEETEDTDILFELYSKNDSCLEKYLKFESKDSKAIVIEKEDIEKEDKSKINLANNEVNCETAFPIKSFVPSIEISRIEPPQPLVEIRKWQCCECGRKYLTEEKMEQHHKLHYQSKVCQCKLCGSFLKSVYEHAEHVKTHTTDRKFSCEFCDKMFSTRANLKAHIYIHSNLRPFKCEECGKAFQQKSILKTHMTLHTGKPFECTLCHRRFSRTAHLNIHMRQHNNIRPYQCAQCPSSYMQKSHLDRHISSSHLGVRFQCSICGKTYTKKPSLNTHMRDTHCTSLSFYSCEICDLDFTKQKGLYYHLKSKHPTYSRNKTNF